MSIWITQCVCPNDHNVMLWAWDDTEADIPGIEHFARADIVERVAAKKMMPCCRICLNHDLRFAHEKTHWKTIEEAEPTLRRAAEIGKALGGVLEQLAKAQRDQAN